jgi:N-acetylglucosamine-6-phosphate deacetylase
MVIQSKRIWIAGQFVAAQLVLEGKIIKEVAPYGKYQVDTDYGNHRILPGLIDIHTHGAYGFDTNDAHPEGLRTWVRRVVEDGVTALLATTVTQSEEILTKAVENVANVIDEGYEGAEILGVHFEGPYLNAKNKGAQPEQFILNADLEMFKRCQLAARGNIRLITMAAERDTDHQLIRYCAQHNVAVSLGHGSATYDEVVVAYGNGARCMTHVHNGMPTYHHREPSMAGAAYRLRGMYGEMICDMNHIHPAVVNNYFTIKGDYAIMVSDSLCAKGLPRGVYQLGGNDFEIRENGSAYLVEGGSLAGSTLRLIDGIRNLVERSEVSFYQAINSCTINPARMLRIDNRKGELIADKDADLIVISDNYEVLETYCLGQSLYNGR